MRYPASETAEKHARILDEAIRLFSERGFSNVSVSEIMKATGLTHGPFYNHFASKDALIAECLERALREAYGDLDAISKCAGGKAAFVSEYLSAGHRDAPGTGCALAALASDIRHEPHARRPFTAHLQDLVNKLASHFPWCSKRTARGDAIRMLAAMIGGLVLSRAVDDEAFSDEILQEVRQGIL